MCFSNDRAYDSYVPVSYTHLVVGSTLSKISADCLTTEYLRYFIQSKYTLLNTQKKGTGTPHLNAQILKESKLIVPSLPEQERIVARIEELFSELDKAVEDVYKRQGINRIEPLTKFGNPAFQFHSLDFILVG